MASITCRKDKIKQVRFYTPDGKRWTISLGQCSKRDAERVAVFVEKILEKRRLGLPLDGETAQWVASLPDRIADRLAACGLIDRKAGQVTLGQWLETYFSKRTDIKPQTRLFYEHTKRNLLECFGPDRPLASLTAGDAEDFRRFLKSQGLADATIARRCQAAKTIFNAAVDFELLPQNPFRKLSGTVRANRERMRFIDRETTQKVIAACPDAEWRLLVALARYGGLRVPSEALLLKWQDIDWENGTMLVHSPKTEHHPRYAKRLVPLFPELRPYLQEAWEAAPEGAEYVISRYRYLVETRDSFHGVNLRTHFMRIIRRAGLEPWPKPWQNLRSSRETELLEEFPIHVVCQWIGNSQPVAREHYLQVTDEHYRRAAFGATTPDGTVSKFAPANCSNGAHRADIAENGQAGSREFAASCARMRTSANTPNGR